jgi:hypothetical protein
MGNADPTPGDTRPPREPGHPLFWMFVAALLFVVVPYYYAGSSEPRIAGLPLWFYLSLAATVTIAVLSVWRIWKHWRLDDDE